MRSTKLELFKHSNGRSDNMNVFFHKKIRTAFLFITLCFVSACGSLPDSLTSADPKTNTSWTAPTGLDAKEVYNAAFRAVSQLDAEMVSNDRETGIISVNKSFPVMFSATPSQVPMTIMINKNGNDVTLTTTSFLKGMGTADVYQDLKTDFYEKLFSSLGITNQQDKVVEEK
jgi:hypothetical protein